MNELKTARPFCVGGEDVRLGCLRFSMADHNLRRHSHQYLNKVKLYLNFIHFTCYCPS